MPEEHLTRRRADARLLRTAATRSSATSDGAVAFTFKELRRRTGRSWLVLVAVRPERQGDGPRHGARARRARRGARAAVRGRAHLASAVPRYLWPGVDLANTRAGMLFETLGFERDLVGINMSIPSTFRRDPPPGVLVERETGYGRARLRARARTRTGSTSSTVAIEHGTAFAARDPDGATIGFGCHSCNRAAWIGPMATDPDVAARRRRLGRARRGVRRPRTRAATRRARSRGSATCASTASAARPCHASSRAGISP